MESHGVVVVVVVVALMNIHVIDVLFNQLIHALIVLTQAKH